MKKTKKQKLPSTTTSSHGDWLNSQYNNRALVSDHGKYFARWAADSKQARAQSVCRLDIPYGDGSDRSLGLNETLDVFPALASHAPVMVFIHGGYWRSLDKSDHSFVGPAFTRLGACVVIPNYALCPKTDGLPVTIEDITLQMVKALVWIYQNISRYGGDPKRITVVGHSAGGHLAAMVQACAWEIVGKNLPVDLVKNTVSVSGLFDLAIIAATPFLNDSLRLTSAMAEKVSPINYARPAQGQLHCFVGGDESSEFQRQNGLMQAAWGKATVPTAQVLNGGYNHFSVLDQMCDGRSPLNHCIRELIK